MTAEHALELLRQLVASPWLFGLVFVLALLDGVLPPTPGETALVTAAVLLAPGPVHQVGLLVLSGAAGAWVGDHIAYAVGRFVLPRVRPRLRPGSRVLRGVEWAEERIGRRGGAVLLASRYIPGVRTATTVALGGFRYPALRFSAFDVAAALFWAGGWSLLGYVGGAAFGGDPLTGLVFGLSLAASVMVASEIGRRVWRAARRPDLTHSAASGSPGGRGGT